MVRAPRSSRRAGDHSAPDRSHILAPIRGTTLVRLPRGGPAATSV